jgi:hypothetical protein
MATLAGVRSFDRRMIYLLLAFAVLGVLLILIGTSKYGAGCWPDCVAYVSTARNLLSGRGYWMYAERPFVHFPPLFPTLLALLGLTGLDPFDAARYVNAIAFGLIVFLSGLYLLRCIRSKTLVVLGSLAILFSTPLIHVSTQVLSEPLFIVLVLLSMLEVSKFLSTGKSPPFFLAATFAALAFLTRYLGLTVVLTALVLLLIKRNIAFADRITKGIALILICILPMIAWLLRNYGVSSTLAGERPPSSYTLGQHIYFTLDTVISWFVPPSSLIETQAFHELPERLQGIVQVLTLTPAPRFAVGILPLLLVTGACVSIICYDPNHRDRERARLVRLMPMLCFLVIYIGTLLSLLAVMEVGQFPPINDRFLSPIYAPLVSLVVFMIDSILWFLHEHFPTQTLSKLLIAGSSLLLVYPLIFNGATITNRIGKGAGGYSHVSYRNSSLIRYLKETPLDGQVYSNAPDLVYILVGIPAKFSPRGTEEALSLRDALASNVGNTYLVWFESSNWVGLSELEEFSFLFDMEAIATASDGVIYVIN